MAHIKYAEALVEGLYISMERDPRVSLIGRHVLGLSPLRNLMDRIRDTFADRIFDPPTSEAGIAAVGVGAAMAGDRPFVDIATASFSFEAWPQIVNEAATAHYMSGGQVTVPVVFHMIHGLRGGGAAQHSHSPQSMMWNCPGLEIVLPSSPSDVKGLICTAIKSDNPTVFIDHPKLFGMEGEVLEGHYEIPFGQADIKREGRDVTVVATSLMVQVALEAADTLSKEGIEVEVVDPRTIVPLDKERICGSVAKTGRLVVVDECNMSCGIASEIATIVAEAAFGSLKAPIARVARPDVPVPFSSPLEDFITPTPDKITAAVRKMLS
jgi:pyruvate dehydrogenase E1 component beta subunit